MLLKDKSFSVNEVMGAESLRAVIDQNAQPPNPFSDEESNPFPDEPTEPKPIKKPQTPQTKSNQVPVMVTFGNSQKNYPQ